MRKSWVRATMLGTVMLATVAALGQAVQMIAPPGCIPAKVVRTVNPVYPAELYGSGIGGAVVVRATVTTDGKLRDATALSGPEKLKQAALDAVSQWVFQPATKDGAPVEMETHLTINFQIVSAPPVE